MLTKVIKTLWSRDATIIQVCRVLARFEPRIHRVLNQSSLHVQNCSNISQYLYYSQKDSAYSNSKKFIKIFDLNQDFVYYILWQNIPVLCHCILLMRTKSITH